MHMFQARDTEKSLTLRQLAERGGIGSGSLLIVGSPAQVADELEAWVDEAGIDGFNLASAVMPEKFTDFVELVVPELQRRGRLKRAYAPGTLRDKLFGRAPVRLAPRECAPDVPHAAWGAPSAPRRALAVLLKGTTMRGRQFATWATTEVPPRNSRRWT